MRPISIRIQNYATQTGVGDDLLFSWKYEAGNHTQRAYRVDLFQNAIKTASTGKIISSEQYAVSIPLAAPLLEQNSLYLSDHRLG